MTDLHSVFVTDQAYAAADEAEEMLERSGMRPPDGLAGVGLLVTELRNVTRHTTLQVCEHLRPDAPRVCAWNPKRPDQLACGQCRHSVVAPGDPTLLATCDLCGGPYSTCRVFAVRVGCILAVFEACSACLTRAGR